MLSTDDLKSFNKTELRFLELLRQKEPRFYVLASKRKNPTRLKKAERDRWFANPPTSYPYMFHPYISSKYETDIILDVPFSGWVGICIEIQGAIFVKGGHSTGKGIKRDNRKAFVAQYNQYFYMPISSSEDDMQLAIGSLTLLDNRYRLFDNRERLIETINRNLS